MKVLVLPNLNEKLFRIVNISAFAVGIMVAVFGRTGVTA